MLATRGNRPSPARTKPSHDAERSREAAGALEEIIAHLPGETRESLLVLAEEHGVARSDGEAALGLLEMHGRARRRVDGEGDEIWELTTGQLDGPSPAHTPSPATGVLPLYSRNDVAEQRWRLIPDWVYCPLCGPVRVA
ncbi:MAG: hypothetical protein KGJ23_11485 [Euryarchaeota archaeon]|nr:hypothetical protein [Euryarchaeota archaeon]MDE1837217.1 hypothetical protein [Euryarchaeota archaeon]MDE1881417.1 hypothetical protein [Euryarchaeota archaeon]MDE2045373.1 hypothetical protein [Thermoplasmata archaeon]